MVQKQSQTALHKQFLSEGIQNKFLSRILQVFILGISEGILNEVLPAMYSYRIGI